MQELLLSCDWGTTSFRLRVVDMDIHKVIYAMSNSKGTLSTFNEWKTNGRKYGISRKDFYLGQLKREIISLSQKTSLILETVPIIISGMACSSIGIEELPYAPLPFSIDGSDVIVRHITCPKGLPNGVLLISGASNHTDVMRGEETQIVGLSSIYEINPRETTICIFPGTHSKHITVKNGKIINFHTYMTGELFALMQQHSILKESISKVEYSDTLTNKSKQAFCLGLAQSVECNLLQTFFSVRINQIFKRLNGKANFFYLSGLLIGTELRSIPQETDVRIMLCSTNEMGHLYKLALKKLNMLTRAIIIPPNIVNTAAFEGHIKIYNEKNVLNK